MSSSLTRGFGESGHTFVQLVRQAQRAKPRQRRMLFLDIEGHRHPDGGFDADMRELQHDFLIRVLAPFSSAVHSPLVTLKNL